MQQEIQFSSSVQKCVAAEAMVSIDWPFPVSQQHHYLRTTSPFTSGWRPRRKFSGMRRMHYPIPIR